MTLLLSVCFSHQEVMMMKMKEEESADQLCPDVLRGWSSSSLCVEALIGWCFWEVEWRRELHPAPTDGPITAGGDECPCCSLSTVVPACPLGHVTEHHQCMWTSVLLLRPSTPSLQTHWDSSAPPPPGRSPVFSWLALFSTAFVSLDVSVVLGVSNTWNDAAVIFAGIWTKQRRVVCL